MAKSSTKREGISNKIRFEVFKRDSFKCQYCGKSAPDVILNVDHIKPVAKGGKNDILNLITSCFECNSGKSDRLISDNSIIAIQRKQIEELSERRLQIEMMMEWRTAVSDKSFEINSIIKYFNDTNKTNLDLSDEGILYFKKLLGKFSLEKIINAIDCANIKYANIPPEDRFDKIEGVAAFQNSSEADKCKMKIYGAIKNKYRNDGTYSSYNIREANSMLKDLFRHIDDTEHYNLYDELLSIVNRCKTYYWFRGDLRDLHEVIF